MASDQTKSAAPQSGGEVDELKHLGYQQVLHRTMGVARSTMVNISISSVTTAIFTLFAFGLFTGGTAFVWTWAVGFAVLMLVTLCFSELGSSMPIAGALYQWGSRLVGPRYGYVIGWLYVAAQIAITAAVAYGIAPFVGSLFGWTLTPDDQKLVAAGIVLASTLINLAGVAIAAAVGAVGAVSEVVGMVVITVVLVIVGITNQSPSVLFHSGGGLPEGSAFLPVALATMLFGSWAYTGLEMATDMAEETNDASKVIPKAAITSLVTTFAVGMVFLIVAVLAIPDLKQVFLAENPLQYIIEGNTSAAFYKITLVIVIIAVFVSAATNQTLTARALFSLARDGKFPAANQVMKVPKSTRVPSVAIILIGLLAAALLLFTQAIGVISVACLTGLFGCYMLVIWGQLWARLTGRWQATHWTMGKWALPVNVLAAVFGTALTINIAWPRGDVIWYERWSGWVFVGGVLLCALAYYVLSGSKRRAIIDAPLPAAHSGVVKTETAGPLDVEGQLVD
jgi:amino acid transporter